MNRSSAVVVLAVSILFFAHSLQADKEAETMVSEYCDTSKMFRCGNSSVFIAKSKVCDSSYDCKNAEDEINCPRE